MSQAQAAADRLPWLSDEPKPPKRRASSNRELASWATAAILLVAGASYWMGAHSWPIPPNSAPAVRPSTTAPLPPRTVIEQPQPEVRFAPPAVSLGADRETPVARPRVEKRTVQSSVAPAVHEVPAAPDEETVVTAAPPQAPAPQVRPVVVPRPLTLWPATESKGAYGRIVRIGAYGSRIQAKLGWRAMVQAYPAVAHLPATVVETRNSRGRSFYRFQIGTTSQAHSEVLCQRMEKIRLSCAVVGLPWNPTGVER